MKKKVNRYAQQIEVGAQNRPFVLRDFSRLLDSQVTDNKEEVPWVSFMQMRIKCRVMFR